MPTNDPFSALQQLGKLIPDPRNANRGTPRGNRLLRDSITANGAGRSILVSADGVVLAGNKTLAQANALGLPVRVVDTAGEELIAVGVAAPERF